MTFIDKYLNELILTALVLLTMVITALFYAYGNKEGAIYFGGVATGLLNALGLAMRVKTAPPIEVKSSDQHPESGSPSV